MVALARINLAAPILTVAGIGLALAWSGRIELLAVLWSWVAARVLVAVATAIAAWRKGWIGRPAFTAERKPDSDSPSAIRT